MKRLLAFSAAACFALAAGLAFAQDTSSDQTIPLDSAEQTASPAPAVSPTPGKWHHGHGHHHHRGVGAMSTPTPTEGQ